MASTLLAVDDSVTMRKVLEITFAGPDFRVVTVPSPNEALQKLKTDKPDLVIADLSLEPDGYELCKAVKKANPGTPVVLLSSKQNVFDAAKASAAQADDHMDKPFDTQQMIDKVKKLLAAQAGKPASAGATGAAPASATPAAATASATTSGVLSAPTSSVQSVQSRPATAASPQSAPPPAAPAPSPSPGVPARAKTLIYNPPTAGAPIPLTPMRPASAGPAPAEPAKAPAAEPAHAHAPSAAVSPVGPVGAQLNGQMTAKLGDLGLTPTQVEAVLALSREVIERVVWEVVPVLAETMIKEEIARLTK